MIGLFETIAHYLAYPFVRYALITGVLIALCSALLGVTLVLRRLSYIGDGLSHVAFGAMAVASVTKVLLEGLARQCPSLADGSLLLAGVLANKLVLVTPVTVLCAILLLKGSGKARIRGDAAIAMLSVGALAAGYLLLHLFSPSTNLSGDVCGTLFGSTSILTLTKGEVVVCAVLSLAVVVLFVLCYNKLFAVTFDENFARVAGTKADAYNLLLAMVTAVIIVLAMNLVGSLLISALVIFPAMSAMRLLKSFRGVTVCAAVISVVCALGGMLVSIAAGTPVGATVVCMNIAVFAVCRLCGAAHT